MVTKLRLVLTTTIVFFSFYGLAQNAYWKQDATAKVIAPAGLQRADFKKAAYFSLNREAFERSLPATASYQSASIVYFPDESGELIAYKVTPSPVMAPELAARYPGIRSFTGRGLHKPEERIRFSISHKGIQSMMVHAGKIRNTFMQKVEGTENQYQLYQRDELPDAALDFICYTFSALQKEVSAGTYKLVDDQLLRRYRIAVSATGEYTRFHGGTKADALAAINATMSRCGSYSSSSSRLFASARATYSGSRPLSRRRSRHSFCTTGHFPFPDFVTILTRH